jgi:hypothetical protein
MLERPPVSLSMEEYTPKVEHNATYNKLMDPEEWVAILASSLVLKEFCHNIRKAELLTTAGSIL